jgi:hypothetical protein
MTIRKRVNSIHAALDIERSVWIPAWRALAEYTAPDRFRYLVTNRSKKSWNFSKIVDNTGALALRTLQAGMMSGVTSPSRPWFRLAHPDPEMNELAVVRDWLHFVTQRMREMFNRSNLYQSLPMVYGDTALFGQAPMGVFEDFEAGMRTEVYPIGSYWISANERGVVDTFQRQYSMTVRQLVMKFGEYNRKTGAVEWSRFSQRVQDAWNRGDLEQSIDVLWTVMPNLDHDADEARLDARRKRYMSVYLEYPASGGREDVALRVSGFDKFPVLVPRWSVTGEDVYGVGPGLMSLGDNKALQLLHKRVMQADEKQINPPLQAPASMAHQPVSQLPGAVNYPGISGTNEKIESIYNVNFDTRSTEQRIAEHQNRLRRAFYEDLFLMVAQSDRREVTAREIDERHEEKLWSIGPVLERNNDELHDPLIDRAFEIMLAQGLVPPPPQELEGTELTVEYISVMAQAQKLVSLGSTDRFLGTVSNIAAIVPDVLDKIDVDAVVDEYADVTGVNPNLVRDTEDAKAIREQRAQAQQAQAQQEQMAQAAQTGKTLSETPVEGQSALDQLLSGNAA